MARVNVNLQRTVQGTDSVVMKLLFAGSCTEMNSAHVRWLGVCACDNMQYQPTVDRGPDEKPRTEGFARHWRHGT